MNGAGTGTAGIEYKKSCRMDSEGYTLFMTTYKQMGFRYRGRRYPMVAQSVRFYESSPESLCLPLYHVPGSLVDMPTCRQHYSGIGATLNATLITKKYYFFYVYASSSLLTH